MCLFFYLPVGCIRDSSMCEVTEMWHVCDKEFSNDDVYLMKNIQVNWVVS